VFNEILVGISSSPIAVLIQFNGRLLISVVGSKIESKFLITLSYFFLKLIVFLNVCLLIW
jgi:hypothetical protein